MGKSRSRRPSPLYLTPRPLEPTPRPSSCFEGCCDFYAAASTSRPTSQAFTSASSSPRCAMAALPPTLTDILLDLSPPPWTLSAFMAYLSQNHCMESLEFTLDTQRYAVFYEELATHDVSSADANERVCALWDKLIQVYIIPCAPREVNIPARIRDNLLNLSYRPSPPHPSALDEAGRIIFELMNDSLLVPFLEAASAANVDATASDYNRSSQYHPRLSLRTGPTIHGFDSEGLTDDSDGNSPPPMDMEPMTPPTTPPTSEWTFGASSPGGLQRAMAAHNKGWKKVGAKLGFSRKSSSRRSTPTSSGGEGDASMSDPGHSNSL